jgi:hypothetical protein
MLTCRHKCGAGCQPAHRLSIGPSGREPGRVFDRRLRPPRRPAPQMRPRRQRSARQRIRFIPARWLASQMLQFALQLNQFDPWRNKFVRSSAVRKGLHHGPEFLLLEPDRLQNFKFSLPVHERILLAMKMWGSLPTCGPIVTRSIRARARTGSRCFQASTPGDSATLYRAATAGSGFSPNVFREC